MAKRATQAKRIQRPLEPCISVCIIAASRVEVLEPNAVTAPVVGLKAFGLASIPQVWTRPFFVVTHDTNPTEEQISAAMAIAGIAANSRLIVRSSGTEESIDRRGHFDSVECSQESVATQIASLRSLAATESCSAAGIVHWVVQEFAPPRAKGHLSNERRVAEDKRDWVAEVEASETHAIESHRISLRTWRDNRPPSESVLTCAYREKYLECLMIVARWAYERLVRVHFEWVWDGRVLHIVQADACDSVPGGVEPMQCVQVPPRAKTSHGTLRAFRLASDDDFKKYRKLANARLYRELSYDTVPFYVMDDEAELRLMLDEGRCSDALREDLATLTARPLVIRTDGRRIPDALKQMLPRSEELRSLAEAERWLLEDLRTKAAHPAADSSTRLADCDLCLIAHHFVPAVAAAWCQAMPDQRRVRIEALWGIPEGLYWHAYDVFDVDTQASTVPESGQRPQGMKTREKRRFKEHFVAPAPDGRWVLHQTSAGPDWQRSITKQEWIEEIAWTSRRVASKAGHGVVVMWFVGIPKTACKHSVLPWYHEPWKADTSPHRAAPRRKLSTSTDFVLSARTDWETLKQRVTDGDAIVRVRVQPIEPDLVRDREFATELGAFAKKHKLIIELEGGILSHAYYMLSSAGCTVECADLDDYATDDYELEFNKLVRDEIPSRIADHGEAVTAFRLSGEALIEALKRKLAEEALEVLDARTTDEIASELADLREVALSLMDRLQISAAEVENRRKKKAKVSGAFEKALMLSKTTVAPSLSSHQLPGTSEIESQQLIAGTIDQVAAIPTPTEDIHVDRRMDANGIPERQFTTDVPVHAEGLRPMRIPFSLPNHEGQSHEMVLELRLDRRAATLRVRTRISNAAVQLKLDLGPESTSQNKSDSTPV